MDFPIQVKTSCIVVTSAASREFYKRDFVALTVHYQLSKVETIEWLAMRDHGQRIGPLEIGKEFLLGDGIRPSV